MPGTRYIYLLAIVLTPLFIAPVMLGGVYTQMEMNSVIIISVAVSWILYIPYTFIFKKRIYIPAVLFPLLLILLTALLQLIPLPKPLLSFLSPQAGYFTGIDGIKLHPLTMSVPDTLYSIIRISTLVLYALLIQSVLSGSRRIRRIHLATALSISGAVVTAFGFFLKLTGTETWMGSVLATDLVSSFPIINPNHAAGFLGISTIVALYITLESRFQRERLLYGSLFVLNFLGTVMTLSRGGILALIFSILLMMIVRKKKLSTVPLILSGLAVLLAFYTSHVLLEREFAPSGNFFSKLGGNLAAVPYFKDFILTGSGLGSFMHVFPFYQENPELFYLQLENEPLQLFLEMGLLPATAILALILIPLFRKRAKRGEGYLIALFFITLQNLADFNLHNFATLFPVLILMTATTNPVRLKKPISKIVLLAASAASVALIFFASNLERFDFRKNRRSSSYETLAYNYPADYKIPMDKAVKLINRSKKSDKLLAGPYISRTFAKAPNYYFNYYLMGRYMLAAGQKDEAATLFGESLRRAEKRTEYTLRNVFRDMKRHRMIDQFREIIPFARENRDGIARFLVSGILKPEERLFLTEGRELEFFHAAAQSYLQIKSFEKLSILLDMAESEGVAEKRSIGGYRARVLLAEGKKREAMSLLKENTRDTENFGDLLFYANLLLSQNELAEAERIEPQLRELAVKSKANLISFYTWKSGYTARKGMVKRSLGYMKKAADLSGKPHLRLRYISLLKGKLLYREALEELNFLKRNCAECKIDNEIENVKQILKQKKDQLLKEMLLRKGAQQ